MSGKTMKDEFQSNTMKTEAMIMDMALTGWYQNNHGTYPMQLTDLKTIGIIASNIDITPYTYRASADQSMYNLTVALPDGSIYQSPGSSTF